MPLRLSRLMVIGLAIILGGAACASEPTPPPTVDAMGTMAAQLASVMLSQTVAAYSPTPLPATATPTPTETMTPEPTSDKPPKRPVTTAFAGCWYGPGPAYVLDSNIAERKYVDLLGIGSIPGWYIIRNPYFHKPCWIEAANLKFDPAMDLSKYPVMTPPPP